MADYFQKYYFEFEDTHPILPASWRVDILDSEGSTPSEPFLLEMGPSPLVLERIENEDAVETGPIGWQATIQYMYTEEPNIPLPTEFFDAPERRFKAEVRKNGVLQGTFYVRPDGSQYADQYPPTVISLTAVDGFSYMKGNVFNAFQESGLLLYDKISLYEAMMTRGMLTVLENNPPINVIQTLYPDNIEPDVRMLFGLFVHTDIFYDFITGPVSISDMLNAFCRAFYANVFTSAGQVWFIRGQDLHTTTFEIDQYTDDETVTTTVDAGFVKVIGPTTDLDGVTMKPAATITPITAIKKAEFEVTYKGINQVQNFDWALFDGSDFDGWVRQPIVGSQITVEQAGTGTLLDPYKMFIPYPQSSNDIEQESSIGTVNTGDIYEFEMRYRFANVNTFRISISVIIDNTGGTAFRLLGGGTWTFGNDQAGIMTITRDGKKREGTLRIKTLPIPSQVPGMSGPLSGPFGFRIEIFTPSGPDPLEPSEQSGVYIYPIKLGIIQVSSAGRHLTDINNADFSTVRETTTFSFIDTGEDGISNTIFTGDSLVPAQDWDNNKPLVQPADIERHMADSYIDQAPRSPMTWEGNVLSNTIDFHHPINITNHPTRRFKQVADVYDVKRAEHEMRLREVFEEGNATVTFTEYDIEEEDEND